MRREYAEKGEREKKNIARDRGELGEEMGKSREKSRGREETVRKQLKTV